MIFCPVMLITRGGLRKGRPEFWRWFVSDDSAWAGEEANLIVCGGGDAKLSVSADA